MQHDIAPGAVGLVGIQEVHWRSSRRDKAAARRSGWRGEHAVAGRCAERDAIRVSLSQADGFVAGPCRSGPDVLDFGLMARGAAGGDDCDPLDPRRRRGREVLVKRRLVIEPRLGRFSTVELDTEPLPDRDGEAYDDVAGDSAAGGSTSDGTELTVPPLTAGSSVTTDDPLAPPQLVHGAATAAGRVKIGRYDWRLWLQPAAVKAATESDGDRPGMPRCAHRPRPACAGPS